MSVAHAADEHDLIRVHGARVNNLKDVSVEIPKRRLTVFGESFSRSLSSVIVGLPSPASAPLMKTKSRYR